LQPDTTDVPMEHPVGFKLAPTQNSRLGNRSRSTAISGLDGALRQFDEAVGCAVGYGRPIPPPANVILKFE